MLYAPPMLQAAGHISINPWSFQALGTALYRSSVITPASTNYIAVGMVLYVPFTTPEPMTITKLFWSNGAAVAGNIDIGIYNTAGTLLISSGTTLQAGTSRIQAVDVTDTTIARGVYYMAMVSDTSGATQKVFSVAPAAGILQSFGVLQQASVTLPLATNASPATFAAYAQAFLPVFGLQGFRTFGP